MKNIAILTFVSIILICCKEKNDDSSLSHHQNNPGCKNEEELSKVRDTFDLKLVSLYETKVSSDKLIEKADSLFSDFKSNSSDLRSQVAFLCGSQISYFKAEIFYKDGKYLQSIDELYKSSVFGVITLDNASALAANYLKLGNSERARTFIDSIGGNDLYDYSLANYYESEQNIKKAIEIYSIIVTSKPARKHSFHKSAEIRLAALRKEKPIFIHEIIFPTGKPGAEWYH